MKYHLTETEHYSLATITQQKSPIVVGYISTDIHGEKTVKTRAAQLLYGEALLSGAGDYSRASFLDAVNQLGASISVSVSDGVFTLSMRSTAATYTKVTKLVATMLLSPHFNATELVRIKKTMINIVRESKENSKAIAQEGLRNALYGQQDRRYSYSDDAMIEAISAVTPKDLKSLHTTVCRLPWKVTLAGNEASQKATLTLIKNSQATSKKVAVVMGPHQQKPPQAGVILKNIPSKQNIDFSIGAPVPITLHHPDYISLSFGLAVLGKWGGFTGRLMSTVREAEGLTYGIYSKTETFYSEEQGYYRIETFFAPDKAVQGITSTFREVKKLFEEGITQAELTKFKQILHTSQVLLQDSTSRLISDLHAYHLQKFSLEEMAEHKNKVATLTLQEVNTAIKTYLDPRHLTVSGAGPINSVKKQLQSILKDVT
jgi:zinc protease